MHFLHRIEKGLEPACVQNCPVHALHFGDISDPNSEVSRLLVEKQHFRLLEEANTKPTVFYLGTALSVEIHPSAYKKVEVK